MTAGASTRFEFAGGYIKNAVLLAAARLREGEGAGAEGTPG